MRVQECSGGGDRDLEVLCEPAIASDPSEEALDDPSAWQDGEADLIGMLVDDLDDDAGLGGDTLAGISSVGEDAFNEGEDRARGLQKRPATVAILDTRWMRFEHEAAPIGIDERMALAAIDLFAGIIAARFTGLRRLHALAVDDSRRGTGLPPNPFTIGYDECVVDLLEQTGIAPCGETNDRPCSTAEGPLAIVATRSRSA